MDDTFSQYVGDAESGFYFVFSKESQSTESVWTPDFDYFYDGKDD